MKNILIIGDSCKDIFIYCNSSRLAPDFPVPILNVVNQVENPGMAKNVQRNIQKYTSCDIITNVNWESVTKTRYVHEITNHMFMRVDSNSVIENIREEDVLSSGSFEELDLKNYKIIVISDYNKGFLNEEDISYICKSHPCVFLDTKKVLNDWAVDAKFIKINNFEYQNSLPFLTNELSNKIIHTVGGDGCIYQGVKYGVDKVEVKDTSGAGDSFMAGLVVEYLKTSDIIESIKTANLYASEVVKHRGVTTI